jgi:hypothetical protein
MIDSNYSIYSSHQILIENQILYFLKIVLFFEAKRKLLDLRILDCPIMIIFFLFKKIAKYFKKYKIDFLQEFDIDNKLNGSDQSFLT